MTGPTPQAEPVDDRETVKKVVELIGSVDSIYALNRVEYAWEDRMKALAAAVLKPGSDEPIDDVDALDYIWDLGGDRSFTGGQDEPFRLKALDYYVGRKVRHVWGTGVVVKMKSGYGIRVRLVCAKCHKGTTTVYAKPGCHNGAFCYIYDRAGKYLADLRNQVAWCSRCAGTRKPRKRKKVTT